MLYYLTEKICATIHWVGSRLLQITQYTTTKPTIGRCEPVSWFGSFMCLCGCLFQSSLIFSTLKVNTMKWNKTEKFHSFNNSNRFIEKHKRDRAKASGGHQLRANATATRSNSEPSELLIYSGDSLLNAFRSCYSYSVRAKQQTYLDPYV